MHSNDSSDFFLREHHDFETKIEKSETDSKRRLFFCLHPRISRQFFSLICKVLENYNSGKCHKICAKLDRPQIFLAGTFVCQGLRLFRYGNPNLNKGKPFANFSKENCESF